MMPIMKVFWSLFILFVWLSLLPLYAQDFLLQGAYGNAQDTSATPIWMKKMKEQASDLAFRGFTHCWLPRASAIQQPGFKDLIKTFRQAGLQPMMDLTILAEENIFQLMPLSQQLRNDYQIKSFRIRSEKEPKPVVIANFLQTYYADNDKPGLLFTFLPDDQTPAKLADWINKVRANLPTEVRADIQPRVYDYALREALKLACEDASYDVRAIYTSSIQDATSLTGYHVVTGINNDYFVNKNKLVKQPLLAYVYLLTNNQIGLPEIFYGDYYGKESGYDALNERSALKAEIDQLLKVHQAFIFNAKEIEYLNRMDTDKQSLYVSANQGADAARALIFQIDGTHSPAGQAGDGHHDVIVAINFADHPLQVVQEINSSNVKIGDLFTNVLKQSDIAPLKIENNTTFNIPNAITIDLPARSYAVWVQGEAPMVSAASFALTAQAFADFVELTWESPSENGVKGYEVEKSVNGATFVKIATLEALGEAGASYLYTDEERLPAEEVAYRIKILLKTGTSFYSSLQALNPVLRETSFELIEGLKSGIKTIKIKSNQPETGKISVFNSEGKAVLEWNHPIRKGVSLAQLDLTALPKGVYIVTVHLKSKTWTKKMVNR